MAEENRPGFSPAARARSVGHALRGLRTVVRTEHNAWIHAAATVAVAAAGLWLSISRLEWIAVVLAAALVWAAEALNTAVEALCDLVEPGHDPAVGRVKDAAAAGVLASALGAALVGVLVFGPRLAALAR